MEKIKGLSLDLSEEKIDEKEEKKASSLNLDLTLKSARVFAMKSVKKGTYSAL